jgi:hypothetical protein
MSTSTPDFLLRTYHGRESGIMIIGTAEALVRLGTQLLSAASTSANAALPDWPTEVASPTVSGPYVDESGFRLSFHVLRAPQLPKSLRLHRRGPPTAVVLAVGALAVIGAVAIVKLVL